MKSLQPARYNPAASAWQPATDTAPVRAAQLTVATFNVWFDAFAFEERATGLLALLEACDADVIALQEVTPPLLERLLDAAWVRERYAISDHTGATVWPYGVLLLMRWTPQRLRLIPLESDMGRHLLVAEFNLNGQHTAIATVHLESLRPSAPVRGAQLAQIFPILDEATHALLMGDFNFCASWPDENARLPASYTDLWPALHPHDPGYTEDTAINRMRLAHTGKAKQVRFDRVLLRSQQPGWVPTAMRLLGTTALGVAELAVFPSDHFGLVATLRWQND